MNNPDRRTIREDEQLAHMKNVQLKLAVALKALDDIHGYCSTQHEMYAVAAEAITKIRSMTCS